MSDMQMKRFLLGALVTAGLVASLVGRADAATIVQNSNIAFDNTNWANSLSFLKFDSSLGTLYGVELSVTSKVRTILQVTNSSNSTTMTEIDITTRVRLRITPTGLGATDLNFFADQFTPGDLAPLAFVRSDPAFSPPYNDGPPYDNPANTFALDNTASLSNIYGSGTYATFTQVGPAPQNINMAVTATAFTTAEYSGGNAQLDQLTYADAQATLTYTYQPVPAPPAAVSLGIGGLVGLVGTGANRLRRRRRVATKTK